MVKTMTKTEYRILKAELSLIRYYLDMTEIYNALKAIDLHYAITWWEENLLNIAEAIDEDCHYRETYGVTHHD